MTVCGHSFCYQCITRYLSTTPQCPVCKLSLQQGSIHPNFARKCMQSNSSNVNVVSIVLLVNDVIAKVKQQEDKEKVLEKVSLHVLHCMCAGSASLGCA